MFWCGRTINIYYSIIMFEFCQGWYKEDLCKTGSLFEGLESSVNLVLTINASHITGNHRLLRESVVGFMRVLLLSIKAARMMVCPWTMHTIKCSLETFLMMMMMITIIFMKGACVWSAKLLSIPDMKLYTENSVLGCQVSADKPMQVRSSSIKWLVFPVIIGNTSYTQRVPIACLAKSNAIHKNSKWAAHEAHRGTVPSPSATCTRTLNAPIILLVDPPGLQKQVLKLYPEVHY